ncbi:hypothetical protein B005_5252 [Nocardiopsis alba ATCC BAA-2165]|uniref:Uncharacterized protein n=1 Tax=Nocardiopsis alba (strain ATCC BAA-2165 / BE74) TaxID=1205910 RepID=J7LD47_NOCAA|nr:hypothetical protein B005_5252 [Nocardiopsis alba ATCC BAA-2165]
MTMVAISNSRRRVPSPARVALAVTVALGPRTEHRTGPTGRGPLT